MRLTESQLKRLYQLERKDTHWNMLQVMSKQIYPLVVKECTYQHDGKRQFLSGGTPALKCAIGCFVAFVTTWERGNMSMDIFDSVIWAAHNNGVFADKFVKANSEWEAIQILNRTSGISR